MDEELIARAVRYFSNGCNDGTHDLCHGGDIKKCRCKIVAQRLEDELEALNRVQTFDVAREWRNFSSTYPDQRWPIAALMRDVNERLCDPPWAAESSAKRTVWLTSALARLGEHGIPPDGLVRIGIRHQLKGLLTTLTVSAQDFITAGGQQQNIPPTLMQWVEALSECSDHASSSAKNTTPDSGLATKISIAMSGEFSKTFDRWLKVATLRDIVNWKYDAETHQELDDEDLGFQGGREVMHWIVDRFTVTHYSEWRRTSLYWELMFASNSEMTSTHSGVPLSILRQRPAHAQRIVDSIVAGAINRLDHDQLVANLSLEEWYHNTVRLLGSGFIPQAIDLAREAVHEHPRMPVLRNTLGLCLIPLFPSDALKELNSCNTDGRVPSLLLEINRVAALWLSGDHELAKDSIHRLLSSSPQGAFLLWNPEDLHFKSEGTAVRLSTFEAQDWLNRTLQLIN